MCAALQAETQTDNAGKSPCDGKGPFQLMACGLILFFFFFLALEPRTRIAGCKQFSPWRKVNLNPVFNLLSTPALVLWEVAVLGPRASWARLCCANLSRGGTTRLPLFLFFFFNSFSIFFIHPSCSLTFQPIAAICHSAGCGHSAVSPPGLSWIQSHGQGPWVQVHLGQSTRDKCRAWHQASKS